MSEAKLKELPRSTAPAVLEMSWDLSAMKEWKQTTSRASWKEHEQPIYTMYTICASALWDTLTNGGVLVVSCEDGKAQIIQRPISAPK